MIEKSVLKKMEHFRRIYKKKEKTVKTEWKKLQKYVGKYLGENDIQNDAGRLEEVTEILSDCGIRDGLISRLCGLQLKEIERGTIREEERRAAENGKRAEQFSSFGRPHSFKEKCMLQQIERLAQIYRKKEREFHVEQRKLHKLVEAYLDENGILDNMKKLDKVIDYLPGGMLRFHLVECKYDLMEKIAEQERISKMSIGIQEGMDGAQDPGDMQVMGMGGIQ